MRSGVIDIPDDVLWARRGERSNFRGIRIRQLHTKQFFFLICRARARVTRRPRAFNLENLVEQ